MPRPKWNAGFSVNIRVLDGQHQKIFDILGNLYDALGKEYDATFLGIRVMEFSLYIATHFDTEELIMSEYHFPGYEAHRKEHEAFKWKVAVAQQDLAIGGVPLSMHMVSSWTDWYEHHFLTFDQKYSSFLNGKGIH